MGSQIVEIVNVIAPVFLVAAGGALLARYVLDRIAAKCARDLLGLERVDEDSVDKLATAIRRTIHVFTFNIAGPALVFIKIYESNVNLETLGEPALVAMLMYVILVGISLAVSAVTRWKGAERKATVLALASVNCANYGLPVVLYAFGDEGVVVATIFMVTHILMHMTVGISIAAWNREGSWLGRLLGTFRFPYIYAIAFAFLLRAFGGAFALPIAIARPIELLGNTWIPLMLVLLGMELTRIRIAQVWRPAAIIAGIKLIVPPLLVFGLVTLLRIEGTARDVLIVQSSMPTAVNGLLVARQFNVRPDLVASVLMLTTFGSILSIALLLGLLT